MDKMKRRDWSCWLLYCYGYVWQHNTHVGDARYTDMASSGEVNVGQLVRKEYGEENVFIVGFGANSGSVIAAGGWGAPMKTTEVPPATQGSWEQILHQLSPVNKIILYRDIRKEKHLNRPVGHRAIGVVYNPQLEHLGNYVPSVSPSAMMPSCTSTLPTPCTRSSPSLSVTSPQIFTLRAPNT